MTLIYFLLLLSVIITIHEAGHLAVAKKFGVYCYEFSFGMGPLLWHKKTGETQYSIRGIPIGGYVAMAGEKDGDAAYPDVVVPEGRRLTDKPAWQKIIIMLAGVIMNFLLAWVVFSMIYLSNGVYYSSPEPLVNTVVAGSPAEKAGFLPGDMILEITKEDGTSIKPKSYLDMQVFSSGYSGTETYRIDRNGEAITIEVTPEFSEENQAYMIGIGGPQPKEIKINFLNCWYFGAVEMGEIASLMFATIRGLLRGVGLEQLSGPVGIYQATETYAGYGISAFLLLLAQLSLNVGIFNLLPLPVLDGGQIVITLCEAAAGRELNTRIKTGIMVACWVLLIGLMVFVTWNDIVRLLK